MIVGCKKRGGEKERVKAFMMSGIKEENNIIPDSLLQGIKELIWAY
jgi:hypothetical protein